MRTSQPSERESVATDLLQTTNTKSPDDLLTEVQAQREELPMSLAWYRRLRTVRQFKEDDGPPFLRISSRVFYRRGALRAWIAQREVR